MVRRMARFCVPMELIRDALAIPDGTTICDIVRHDDYPDVFIFYVEHPDLPELAEGAMLPEVAPVISADYDRKPSTWLSWDWGLDSTGGDCSGNASST